MSSQDRRQVSLKLARASRELPTPHGLGTICRTGRHKSLGSAAMGREGATVNKPLRSPLRNPAHALGEGGSWIPGTIRLEFEGLNQGSHEQAVHRMKITLTEKQIRGLVPYYDRVQASAVAGNPGMLVAQIRRNGDGKWWMEPGFLDHAHALCITEKGQVCSPMLPPTAPESSTALPNARSAPDEPVGTAGSDSLAHQSQDSCA